MLNDEYTKNAYLKFRKGFERLRTNIKFRFDDLIVEENKEEKYIRISLEPENNKDIAVFIIPEVKGTKINELPHSFVEAYYKYIGLSKEKKKAINPFVMNKIYDLPEKLIEFENNCDAAINLYVFYKNVLLKALRAEKNREKKGKRNVEKIIHKKYDEKKASELIEKIVPDLIGKLNYIINEEESRNDIQKRLNENDWLFQLQVDDRRNTLNKIIGKDKIDKDTFSEQDLILLCDFSQEGYKLLWQLIEAVYDSRIEPFDRIEKKFAEKKKKAYLSDNKPEELDKDLCEVVRAYYEKNLKNTTSILDSICISEIKYIMENSDISKQSQMYILYKLTKNSVIKRKLFWDIFSWEDIKNNIYINNNEKGV